MIGPLKRWRAARGALPERLRAELEAEGLELLEERVAGRVTYRHYEALGQRPTSGTQQTLAAIALTPRRLVVRGTQRFQLDAPPGPVNAAFEPPDRLLLSYEAADLYESRSGAVELQLQTPRAAEIHARLQAWSERPSS